MTARDLLRILREGWILILVSTVLFAGAGVAYAATRAPQFESSSTVSVSACITVADITGCDPVEGLDYALNRASFYADQGATNDVFDAAVGSRDVSDDVSASSLAEATSISQTAGTALISVSVTWDDPELAAELTDAVAEAFVSHSEDTAGEVEPDATGISFAVIADASAPVSSSGGDRRTLVLLVLLGAVLGFALATAKWALDRRIRDVHDAEGIAELDVLTTLPRSTSGATVAEPFHQLRSIIASRVSASPAAVIAVVSSRDDDASVLVASGLARSFAAARSRVAVVQADRGEGGTGIDEVLSGAISPEAFLDAHVGDGPSVFTYALDGDSDGVALATPEFNSFIDALRGMNDIVLVATAPASRPAAMSSAAQHADAAIVLIETLATTRPELASTLRALDLVGVAPIGLVAVSRSE